MRIVVIVLVAWMLQWVLVRVIRRVRGRNPSTGFAYALMDLRRGRRFAGRTESAPNPQTQIKV